MRNYQYCYDTYTVLPGSFSGTHQFLFLKVSGPSFVLKKIYEFSGGFDSFNGERCKVQDIMIRLIRIEML